MVNTRSKIKKIDTILINYFSKPCTKEDPDQLQSSESGALVGSNDDLLTELLLRLPAYSILRFKSVSKHWQSLLSHKHFTLRYDNLLKSPGLFFAHNGYFPFDVENRSPRPMRNLDFCYDPHGIKIVQSCNGLLLCCSDTLNKSARKYYVFNPTTMQFAIIPPLPGGKAVRITILFMGLAFHHADCVDYKVVCIRTLGSDWGLLQIQIYSSATRKWKVSVESFSVQDIAFEKGVYWNGAIHWFPDFRKHMYFDIISKRLQTLPSPTEIMSSSSRVAASYLGESRGHLHLIMTDYLEYNRSLAFNVYEMLSDYSGWFVKYKIDLDELTRAFPDIINHPGGQFFDVIDVVRGEKEEDTFIVVESPTKLITYNVYDKSSKQIFNDPNLLDYMYNGYLDFHRYTETLTSL